MAQLLLYLGRLNSLERIMDLAIWLPALALLGLAGIGLMFLFVQGCEKV